MAQAKFDIKTEAARPLYATVGATDLAVEVARQYVTDVQGRLTEVQKKVAAYDFEPKNLNDKAQNLAKSRVDVVTKEAKDRQAKLEKRLAELQAELKDAQAKFEARLAELQSDAKAFPAKAQAFVTEYVNDVSGTYTDLVKRGEQAVAKLRRVELKVDVDPKATKTTVTAEAKTSTGARKTPATKKPATKTASKAPATKKATTKKSSTTKSASSAPAKKSSSAPAKKAPAAEKSDS